MDTMALHTEILVPLLALLDLPPVVMELLGPLDRRMD